ncbi:NUDIX domain-containing protein [Pararhodobacter sp. CCB-MM2]|uniref:NUDIX domain-containing protein n=1 Tax=Pararhodobacter sp. CCB-MM2 TaxID=1786003 RepID=UPI000831CF27|nr:NUDIX domain-containing protein [Pararhodobacter sp. CCB-MM2]
MTAKPLFLFGILRHAPLFQAVSGISLAGEEAFLDDHAVQNAADPFGRVQDYPCIVASAGSAAPGILVWADGENRARLDYYEKIFHYVTRPVTVRTAAGTVDAEVYVISNVQGGSGKAWSLPDWEDFRGALNTKTAAMIMASRHEATPEQMAARYTMLASHAAAQVRASREEAPATRRRSADPSDVSVEARRHPYHWFFGVEETDLRFRRFSGGMSGAVNRAAFVMADAVTVLPYDPVRDLVLLVEQFRTGPYLRADRNPWTLECIAGRVDPTETPEQAARREALEEAGLDLKALLKIANYYPSPGAVTEYLYTYLAVTDLPDGTEGVHGLESEAEDIRTHCLPFDELMALIESGEVANGPLITSAYWLAGQRERLRAQSSA